MIRSHEAIYQAPNLKITKLKGCDKCIIKKRKASEIWTPTQKKER